MLCKTVTIRTLPCLDSPEGDIQTNKEQEVGVNKVKKEGEEGGGGGGGDLGEKGLHDDPAVTGELQRTT